MPRRSYNQYCSMAKALDVVGDRWTLLIVRELMVGPRRYTDLLDGLPGIGTNHLASRLKRLVSRDVVRKRTLPPPAASTVYELTDRGSGLEPVVLGLARWGLDLLGTPDPELEWRPDWTVVALRARFDPAAARGIEGTYQFRIDGQPFWARVADGRLETGLGDVEEPDLTITADREAFLQVAAGEADVEEMVARGRYRLDGDRAAFERVAAVFPSSGPREDATPFPSPRRGSVTARA